MTNKRMMHEGRYVIDIVMEKVKTFNFEDFDVGINIKGIYNKSKSNKRNVYITFLSKIYKTFKAYERGINTTYSFKGEHIGQCNYNTTWLIDRLTRYYYLKMSKQSKNKAKSNIRHLENIETITGKILKSSVKGVKEKNDFYNSKIESLNDEVESITKEIQILCDKRESLLNRISKCTDKKYSIDRFEEELSYLFKYVKSKDDLITVFMNIKDSLSEEEIKLYLKMISK